MIVIDRFSEAHHLYRQNRIPFRLLQDQASVLIGLTSEPYRPIDNALDVTEEGIAWLLRQPEAKALYADILGGDVHLCECEADLRRVQGCDFDWANANGGKWPCCMDVPITWDSCAYLSESNGEPQWVLFLQVWSDSGGPVYYLPRQLWTAARVEEHMAATNGFWSNK